MKLHAILCWYDESPTWLAGCVASLTRIGVDHVIAVDGRYPHFKPGAATNSRLDQVDAITSTASAAGVQVTAHRISEPMLEPEKRTLAFRLLNATASSGDWVLVIDADEMIVEGNETVRDELAAVDSSTHVVACRISCAIDPYARPEDDNGVTSKTLELYQKHPISAEFASRQSRFWRVLDDMRVDGTHFHYSGVDDAGVRWNLRPDIGTKHPAGLPVSPIGFFEQPVTIEHRKNHRTTERRALKVAYYTTRDELGLERVTT